MSQLINNFSLVSRLFGNLFLREPVDPILAGTFAWLQSQGLSQIWVLDVDDTSRNALDNIQMKLDLDALTVEYQRLFVGEFAKVDCRLSAYGLNFEEFMAFRQQRDLPTLDNADHFALLLLTASWLEDHVESVEAQRELFETFLLPCASRFLTQVESHSNLPFYRSLANLTREILAAMADELDEN